MYSYMILNFNYERKKIESYPSQYGEKNQFKK